MAKIILQRALGQMRIAPAHYRDARQSQGAGQGTELIVDHQYRTRGRAFRQARLLLQQIQVSCIERLQCRITGWRVAVESETTERGIATLHGRAGKRVRAGSIAQPVRRFRFSGEALRASCRSQDPGSAECGPAAYFSACCLSRSRISVSS